MIEAMTLGPAQFKKTLKLLFETMPHRSVFVSGPTGIGKSEMIHQVGNELNLKVEDIRLAGHLPEDIRGIPEKSDDGYFEMVMMRRLKPFFQRGAKGILFFDEINQASSEVLSALFELVLDRRLNGRKLGDGVRIVSAGNLGDVYGVTDMSPALERRFVHLAVIAKKEDWAAYMNTRDDVEELVVKFILKRKSEVLSGVNEEATLSPAQWTSVAQFLYKVGNKLDENMEAVTAIVSGMVGTKLALDLMKYIKTHKVTLSVDDVLYGDYENKVRPKVKKLTQQKKNSQLAEVVDALVPSIIAKFPNSNDIPKGIVKRVTAFLMDLPKELAAKLMLNINNDMYGLLDKLDSDTLFKITTHMAGVNYTIESKEVVGVTEGSGNDE